MTEDLCIFCKIISQETPAYVVYEDEKVIAFLDRKQIQPGHTMVIPKQHIDHFIDMPDDLTSHLTIVANKIGRKIQAVLKPKRVGIVVSGFGVAHAHYHVIPLHNENDITSQHYVIVENNKAIFTHSHLQPKLPSENVEMLKLISI